MGKKFKYTNGGSQFCLSGNSCEEEDVQHQKVQSETTVS